MSERCEKYDDELRKNHFMNRHYECLPFIGNKYDESRLLLIGESHYIPKSAVQYVDREDFYKISFDDLPEGEYKDWVNTRSVFEYRANTGVSFKNFFSRTAAEIAKILYHTETPTKEQKMSAMHQYAFINYYKRPSYAEGKTITKITDEDNKYAYDVSCYIIDILKPRLIVFLSKKAYDSFCARDRGALGSRYDIVAVSHPSSPWWYRKRNDGKTAKDDFYGFISAIL